jgi:hypothetical protein
MALTLDQILLQALGPELGNLFLSSVPKLSSESDLLMQAGQFYDPYFQGLTTEAEKAQELQQTRSQEDFDTLLSNLAVQEQRTGEDAKAALDNIARQRGFTTQDYQTALARLNEKRREEQFNENLARRAEVGGFNERFGGSFGSPLQQKLEAERQQQRQFGLNQLTNQEQDIQTGYERGMGDLGLQEQQVQLARGRALQDIGSNRQTAQRGFERSTYDLGELLRKQKRDIGQQRQGAIGGFVASRQYAPVFDLFG